ncbi:ROK family protein [Nocardiopsis sediminis]|uniref:ROK family protein n=1 Tax=Nocardiopsis sediminis TaxID=1778267 RepID=A0ABV8FUN9_9ACTN
MGRGDVNTLRETTTMTKPVAGSMTGVRKFNTATVLNALRAAGTPLRVLDLMEVTGLSRPTVETLAESLSAQGWATAAEGVPLAGRQSPGRPARTYAFNARAGWVLGIDVGAHKVSACRADLRGRRLAVARRTVGPGTPADVRLDEARTAVGDVLRGAASAPVLAACLATPGAVDPRRGRVLLAPALPGWDSVDFGAWARDFLACPLDIDNDANLAAVAEQAVGVARDRSDVVFVLLGERLGAGITTGGRLLRGRNGAAGEIGYIRHGGADEPPPAGYGPLESHVNAHAIVGMVEEELARPDAPADSPLRRAFTTGEEADGRLPALAAGARDGDPAALRVLERLCGRLAEGIAPLLLALNPELLVLGGGVSSMGDVLHAPLAEALARTVLFPPELALSALGDRAVVTGAVHAALTRFEETTMAGILA